MKKRKQHDGAHLAAAKTVDALAAEHPNGFHVGARLDMIARVADSMREFARESKRAQAAAGGAASARNSTPAKRKRAASKAAQARWAAWARREDVAHNRA